MLATVLHLLKGTPYVYQGEEIGMTNVPFTAIEQYKDVETLNMHRLHLEAGLSPDEFIAGANANGRDNARTPMQWTDAEQAGFTTGVPWIEINPNFRHVNVNASLSDSSSILSHYRQLIRLRKEHPVIVYGQYQSFLDQDPQFFVYTRTLDDQKLLVVANFSATEGTLELPEELQLAGECISYNYKPVDRMEVPMRLKPYEAFAILCEGNK
jgi:oligo-1,6-glucosidase